MFLEGDIVCITGLHNTGKTLLARYLAKTINKNYIYIDFIHISYEKLDELYNTNKNTHIVIIFDNFVELKNNKNRMDLFFNNNKLTLIFVLNYISNFIISKADILFFSKINQKNILNSYYKHIYKYCKINKQNLYFNIHKLKKNGFLCVDKDNLYTNNVEEEIIKIEY